MSINYWLNCMGPLNEQWIKDNGDCWLMGRIDIWGAPLGSNEVEYPIPAMHYNDWISLSDWLNKLRTNHILSLKDLINNYEKENSEIQWLKRPEMLDKIEFNKFD